MILSSSRGKVIDYLGAHQHLAVDIHCSVDDHGGMCIRSGDQRFYEGPIAFRIPSLFSGVAEVREWWDTEGERFGIDVHVIVATSCERVGRASQVLPVTVSETKINEREKVPPRQRACLQHSSRTPGALVDRLIQVTALPPGGAGAGRRRAPGAGSQSFSRRSERFCPSRTWAWNPISAELAALKASAGQWPSVCC